MQGTTTRTAAEASSADRSRDRLDPQAHIEAVKLRNYDHWEGHSLHVTVGRSNGEPALAERHYLTPGQSARLRGPLAPGYYEVRVRVDGVERVRTHCRLDDTTSNTAVVEVGNGVVSVAEGT